ISWHKEFIGRQALLKTKLEQPQRLLVGFEMLDRAVPREQYPIAVSSQGNHQGDKNQIVGHVTTGMKSPTLDKFLGLGYVPRQYNSVGTEIAIIVRDQPK